MSFKIKNEGERATVYIYGTIGEDYWSPEDENRAKAFSQTLSELSPKPLDIRIDSTGGDVYEGFAIASAIQRYEGDTCAYVDGLAASAASYIALMADKVVMNDYAMIMIHNAWTVAIGNRDELRDLADRLENIDKTIAGIISARSSLDMEEVMSAMSEETWYTGQEAKDAGMCDEVIVTEQRMAASLDMAIAKHYRNIPMDLLSTTSARIDAGHITAGIVSSAYSGSPLGSSETAEHTAPRITIDSSGITITGRDIANTSGIGVQLPGAEPALPPAIDPAPQDLGEGASHAESNLIGDEGTDAKAILLGNRVYRKEN